jgi:hypothetical protein
MIALDAITLYVASESDTILQSVVKMGKSERASLESQFEIATKIIVTKNAKTRIVNHSGASW